MRPLRSTLTALVLALVLVLAAAPTALAAPITADSFGWLSAVWQAVAVWLPGGGENGCMIDPNGGCVPSGPSGLAAGATAEPEQPAGSDSTSSTEDSGGSGNLSGDGGPGLDPNS